MCELCRRAVCAPRCPGASVPRWPRCPVCGGAAEQFYEQGGRIIGCETCVGTVSWELVRPGLEDGTAWRRES